MTLAHPLIGLILGKKFGYTLSFVAGSVLPDIDHLAILIKNRHFKPKEIFNAMKNEKEYGENYKTPYTHSLLAWFVISLVFIIINKNIGVAFSVGYLFHLVLDVIDTDEKQLFYPFKKRIKGFLPVFDIFEIIATVVLLIIYMVI